MKQFFDLIRVRALAELRAEAARGYFGFWWWILEPALYLGVFYVVFGLVFERGGPGFMVFLVCGLFPWKWFDSSVRNGATAITANAGLVRQVYLPKSFFALVVVAVNTMKFAFVLLVLLGFLWLAGVAPGPAWFGAVPVLGVQLYLIVSVALFFSAVVPLLPDLRLVINNGLTLWFFLSGVFYDIRTAEGWIRTLFHLNPMALIIDQYRRVFIDGLAPEPSMLLWVGVLASPFLAAGMLMLQRWDRHYPKIVA